MHKKLAFAPVCQSVIPGRSLALAAICLEMGPSLGGGSSLRLSSISLAALSYIACTKHVKILDIPLKRL